MSTYLPDFTEAGLQAWAEAWRKIRESARTIEHGPEEPASLTPIECNVLMVGFAKTEPLKSNPTN